MNLVNLPKILDQRGNLSFIEGENHVPFTIKRTFWIYDVPGGEVRGGHAYRENEEFIVALSGSFEVVLDDGNNKRTVTLNRPNFGLHIPPGIWAAEQGFSGGSIYLVLTSHTYN